MRRHLLWVCIGLAACSGDKKDDGDGSGGVDEFGECDSSSDCAGGRSCLQADQFGPVKVCLTECDATNVIGECGDNVCVQASNVDTEGYCSDLPPGAELDLCFGAERGSCDTDLDCEQLPVGGARCVQSCNTGAPVCDAGEYCQQISLGTAGACWDIADSDEFCIPIISPAEACSNTDDRCVLTANGFITGECKEPCQPSEIGTGQASCASNTEECLYGPLFEEQLDENDDPVTCTTTGVQDTCDSGYTCTMTYSSSSGQQKVCQRPTALCGTAAPLLTNLPTTLTATVTTDQLCGAPNEAVYCPAPADGNALVECVPVPRGEALSVGGTPATCDSEDQVSAAQCALYSRDCIRFNTGDFCGFLYRVCVAFCESPDGSTAATCPTGTLCDEPESPDLPWVYQNGGVYPTNDDVCDDNPGKCTGEFTCLEGRFVQKVCARPRKACVET
jgi:hypothetical protein